MAFGPPDGYRPGRDLSHLHDDDDSDSSSNDSNNSSSSSSSPDLSDVHRRERQQRHRSQLPDVDDDEDEETTSSSSTSSSSGSSSSSSSSSSPSPREINRRERQQRHRSQLPDVDQEPEQTQSEQSSGGDGGFVDRVREGVSSGIDTAQEAADEELRERTGGDVGISQDWTSTEDSGGVGNVVGEATSPISDSVNDFQERARGTDGEYFGDIDWSAGLGDPSTDEVEEFADSLPGRAEGAARTATEPVVGFSQGEGRSPFSGESAGHAVLDAAGYEDAADTYQGGIETFSEEIVPQTAAGVAGIPSTALEAGELALNPENTDDLAVGAAAAGKQQIEFIRQDPAKAGAGIVGGAAAGAGFGRFLGSTRLGSGRTGAAMRKLDADPASRALTEGQRAVSGVRNRFGSRGADIDSDPVPSGRSEVGSRGMGSLFDADAVDEARGVSGPSRVDVTRGRARRRASSAQERVSDFLSGFERERGQMGGGRGQILERGEGSRSGQSSQPTFTDFDTDPEQTPSTPGGQDIDIRQDALSQYQDQLRGDAQRTLESSRQDIDPDFDPVGRSGPELTMDPRPDRPTFDSSGPRSDSDPVEEVNDLVEESQRPEVTQGTKTPPRTVEDTRIEDGELGAGVIGGLSGVQEPDLTAEGEDIGSNTGSGPRVDTGPTTGVGPDTETEVPPQTETTPDPDPTLDPDPDPDPDPDLTLDPDPDPDPDPYLDPDPDPDPDFAALDSGDGRRRRRGGDLEEFDKTFEGNVADPDEILDGLL